MCGMFLHAYVRQWPTEEIIVKMYQANYLKYQRDRKSYKIRRFDNAYNRLKLMSISPILRFSQYLAGIQ